MASINMSDKRNMVIAFVVSKVSGRLRNLLDQSIDHFEDVAREIYIPDAITKMNTVVRNTLGNLEIARAVLNTGSYGSLPKNNITSRAVTGLRVSNDPFGIKSMINFYPLDYDVRQDFDAAVKRIVEDREAYEFPFEIPLLTIVEVREEDPNVCDLEDKGPELWESGLVERLSVTDCATKKAFHATGKKIAQDTIKLYNSIWDLVRPLRTDTAVFAKVPQLQDFYEQKSAAENDVAELLASMED